MKRFFIPLGLLLSLAGCATQSARPDANAARTAADTTLSVFSSNEAGGLPQGWEPMILLRNKKQTQYELVSKDNATVLHARADSASSGLMQKVDINAQQQPWLHWSWKITSLVNSADNTKRATEDSPVRIILGFDGDKDTMPFTDQVLFETARVMTGYEFPYATLMYIWENNKPTGTIIGSTYTSRIKMMVAESGSDGIGEWRNFARNVIEDFEKAFGEKPGRLIGVGVLTDTDNTGESAEAWYGDIQLLRERFAHHSGPGSAQPALSLTQRK
ncbi:DUF3047 domain-containing protein [Noviherbaspirillum denitrificans]|uniref:DUF3047 domain-containing protein n=1 Tax=Noviherbaspirillum denitrificans TaxID=1968433 RepID=A0A254THB7_9BURK|nr:DUF3047 domain-containing protein [Noviherbaspirillum denitrificans]OWW21915.1 hypothetical protein AYR66_22895 [Noviherbaspirillum denitrificans]